VAAVIVLLLLACGASPELANDPVAALRAKPIVLTRHASCRMDCRKVDRAEIAAVLKAGRHVPERTRNDGECPSHALEGPDSEGGPLRVVFADCPGEARVVTVIDLDDDWPCDCR
jgi:hypothetical protein